MAQILIGGGGNAPNSSIGRFAPLGGAFGLDTNAWATTQSNVTQIITADGSLTDLYVELDKTPRLAGSGTVTFTYTVYVNGVASALTCGISNTDTTGSDTAHSVPVVKGDTVCFVATANTPYSGGTKANTVIPRWKTKFTPTTAGQSLILGVSKQKLNTGTSYCSISAGSIGNSSNNASYRRQLIPSSGTLKNLYIKLTTAPGGVATWTYTVRKNGVNTALTLTISGANTTGNVVSDVAFIAGDEIDIVITPTGTPVISDTAMGAQYISTDANEFLVFGNLFYGVSTGFLYDGTDYFRYPMSPWAEASAHITEAKRLQLGGEFIAKKLYVKVDGAPGTAGSGKGYTVTLRSNSTDTALAVTIDDLATTGNNTTSLVTIANTDDLSIKIKAHGTPTGRSINYSFAGVESVAGDQVVDILAVQALTLTQKTPTINFDCNVYPAAQNLTLNQKTPTETFDYSVSVNAQNLALTQHIPFVQTDASLDVGVSAQPLTLTQNEPTISIESGGVGDENTYFICDTAVGNVDTLKKYIDGVLVEEDTATTKTVYTNVVFANNGFGKIINLVNTGDNKTYTMSQVATTSEYLVLMNNGLYSTDDNQFPFSVFGTTLTFVATLPTDMALTKIKLICV